MQYVYLVALVFSDWDGHVVSQKIMARFENMKECEYVRGTQFRNADTACLPDAQEFDKPTTKPEGE